MDNFHNDILWLQVKELVIELLNIPESQVTSRASFTKDLGVDSLDLLELFLAAEKKFQIPIPDEAAEQIRTPGELHDFISVHQKPAS